MKGGKGEVEKEGYQPEKRERREMSTPYEYQEKSFHNIVVDERPALFDTHSLLLLLLLYFISSLVQSHNSSGDKLGTGGPLRPSLSSAAATTTTRRT